LATARSSHPYAGHSPGGIALWERRTGILLSGDIIYDGPLIDDRVSFRSGRLRKVVAPPRCHAGADGAWRPFPQLTRRRLGVVIDEYLVGRRLSRLPSARMTANRNRAAGPQLLDLGAALLALVSPFLGGLAGLVGRRGFGTWVAARMSSTSRSRASARLRSWLRKRWASITSTPSLVIALAGEAHQARLHIRRQTGRSGDVEASSTAGVETLLTFCRRRGAHETLLQLGLIESDGSGDSNHART